MTEIYPFKKKSEVFLRLKKFAAKLKAQKNLMQRFKSNNGNKFDLTAYKNQMQIEGI